MSDEHLSTTARGAAVVHPYVPFFGHDSDVTEIETARLLRSGSDHASPGPLSELLWEQPEAVAERERNALRDLLSAHGDRCVLFGAGTLGKKAIALFREIGIEPLALTDSNPARWGGSIDKLTILSPMEAAERYGSSAIFFVTIWNEFHWFRDTFAKLTELGCTSISSYAPIFWRFGSRFMNVRLLNEPPHKLYQQLDAVLKAEIVWADQESLDTYRSNILWRAHGDPCHLPFPAPLNTYFPADIFRLLPSETVVDCGAFDGDTIRQVIDRAGSSFNTIHAVEADPLSLKKLQKHMAHWPSEVIEKIEVHECAVGAKRMKVRFETTGCTGSKICMSGGIEVDIVPIDELFAEKSITMIKMDIEGAEYEALTGADWVIRRDRPILAVCVYLTQEDLWRLPLLIQSMLPEHSLFLRTYEGDGFQTVLYAIPPDRMLSAAERAFAPKPLKSAK